MEPFDASLCSPLVSAVDDMALDEDVAYHVVEGRNNMDEEEEDIACRAVSEEDEEQVHFVDA